MVSAPLTPRCSRVNSNSVKGHYGVGTKAGCCSLQELGKSGWLEDGLGGAVGGTRTGSPSPVPGPGRKFFAGESHPWGVSGLNEQTGPEGGCTWVGCQGRASGGSTCLGPSSPKAGRRGSTLHLSALELSPSEWQAGEKMVSCFLQQLEKVGPISL